MKNISYLFLAIQSTEKSMESTKMHFQVWCEIGKELQREAITQITLFYPSPKWPLHLWFSHISYLKSLSLSFIVDRANQLVFVWDWFEIREKKFVLSIISGKFFFFFLLFNYFLFSLNILGHLFRYWADYKRRRFLHLHVFFFYINTFKC